MNKLNIFFCIIMKLKALFNQFIWSPYVESSLRIGNININPLKTANIKKRTYVFTEFLILFCDVSTVECRSCTVKIKLKNKQDVNSGAMLFFKNSWFQFNSESHTASSLTYTRYFNVK